MHSTRALLVVAVAAFALTACGGAQNSTGGSDGVAAVSIKPDPADAENDVPDAYADDCQVDDESAVPKSCTAGDEDGDKTIALVGDSKALQWISALDIVGRERGWKVVTYTKSACTYSAATLSRDGRIYQSCTEWNAAVTTKLLAEKPDLVLTSQGKNKALDDPQDVDGGESQDAMVAGLTKRWAELAKAGLTVAALRDNPHPPQDLSPVYECVEKNIDSLDKCSYDRAEGEAKGGGPVQVQAAEKAKDVTLVDVNDDLCPGDTCPAVVDGLLVYRDGSHLTRTFVDALAPQLSKQLSPIVKSAG